MEHYLEIFVDFFTKYFGKAVFFGLPFVIIIQSCLSYNRLFNDHPEPFNNNESQD